MKTKTLIVLLIIGTLTFSCSKDEDSPAPVTPPTPVASGNSTGNAQPSFVGADASLWAVQSLSVTQLPGGLPPITNVLGIGVGIFIDATNNFVDVGNIELNGNALIKNPNNSYTYVPGLTSPMGIDFTGDVDWDVTGGNGFTGFTRNITIGFPTISEISSSATITKANGYTLTVNSVAGADSVLFLVGGVNKTIPGNATSCTFSATELSTLDNGPTVIQAAAYISTNETIGGKMIYFGNETVQTKTATVQ